MTTPTSCRSSLHTHTARRSKRNPAGFCTIDLSQCAQVGDIYALDVPAGYPLQLSLSTDVSDAQWALLAVYEDADGNQTGEPRVFEPGEALAVTVESSSDPVQANSSASKSTSPSVREANRDC